ncbi:hypothetical protein [Alkaliphilus sp. B6464]|uniref:hypothetical protein n=1 Tax=Alkaliphilus sp. B6464 TaxID=2731219 RepID=UPI001BA86021|nr:hypothetical protein [Alkaliphilus sp. B6464]QUH21797.1 hypothetical protein HYG84_17835 [Alkaliphilus sp. B6464]
MFNRYDIYKSSQMEIFRLIFSLLLVILGVLTSSKIIIMLLLLLCFMIYLNGRILLDLLVGEVHMLEGLITGISQCKNGCGDVFIEDFSGQMRAEKFSGTVSKVKPYSYVRIYYTPLSKKIVRIDTY